MPESEDLPRLLLAEASDVDRGHQYAVCAESRVRKRNDCLRRAGRITTLTMQLSSAVGIGPRRVGITLPRPPQIALRIPKQCRRDAAHAVRSGGPDADCDLAEKIGVERVSLSKSSQSLTHDAETRPEDQDQQFNGQIPAPPLAVGCAQELLQDTVAGVGITFGPVQPTE
ncbi:hypothetical protein SAMN04515678_10137 [Roseivivax sediminis]|uniref:Uncharacterized protein n=1 Tax=Roseivivax sediminis TaxID=936889 RepID=A0A1I1S949_9RHOB|nr:hypothetical protein SAMN04515678_10137 [Roseivivax sediminis]